MERNFYTPDRNTNRVLNIYFFHQKIRIVNVSNFTISLNSINNIKSKIEDSSDQLTVLHLGNLAVLYSERLPNISK